MIPTSRNQTVATSPKGMAQRQSSVTKRALAKGPGTPNGSASRSNFASTSSPMQSPRKKGALPGSATAAWRQSSAGAKAGNYGGARKAPQMQQQQQQQQIRVNAGGGTGGPENQRKACAKGVLAAQQAMVHAVNLRGGLGGPPEAVLRIESDKVIGSDADFTPGGGDLQTAVELISDLGGTLHGVAADQSTATFAAPDTANSWMNREASMGSMSAGGGPGGHPPTPRASSPLKTEDVTRMSAEFSCRTSMGSVADCSMLSDGQRVTIATPGQLAVSTGTPNEDPCGQNNQQLPRPSTPGFAGNSFQAFGDEDEMPTSQEYRPRSESLSDTVLQVPRAADEIAALARPVGTKPLESNTHCSVDVEALCAENLLLRQEVERQRLQIQELAAGRAAANAPIPVACGVTNSACNALTGPETTGSEPDDDGAICSAGGDAARKWQQGPTTLTSAVAAAAATAAAAVASAAAAAAVRPLQTQVSTHETTVASSAATPVSIKVRSPVAQAEVRPPLELASPIAAPVGTSASKVGRSEWWQHTPEASPVPSSVEPMTQVASQVLAEGRRVEVWSQDTWLAGTVVAVPSCDKEGRGRWAVQCDADRKGELTFERHVRALFEADRVPTQPVVPQRFISTGVRDIGTPKSPPRPHHTGTTVASTAGAPSPVPSGTHSVPVPGRPLGLIQPLVMPPQQAQLQMPHATGLSVQSAAAHFSRAAGNSATVRVGSVEPTPRRQYSVGTPLTAAALDGLATQMVVPPMTPNRYQPHSSAAAGAEPQRSVYAESATSPRPGYTAVAALGIRTGATPVQQQPAAGASASLRVPVQQPQQLQQLQQQQPQQQPQHQSQQPSQQVWDAAQQQQHAQQQLQQVGARHMAPMEPVQRPMQQGRFVLHHQEIPQQLPQQHSVPSDECSGSKPVPPPPSWGQAAGNSISVVPPVYKNQTPLGAPGSCVGQGTSAQPTSPRG